MIDCIRADNGVEGAGIDPHLQLQLLVGGAGGEECGDGAAELGDRDRPQVQLDVAGLGAGQVEQVAQEGFERTAALSVQPAEFIAAAAQQFGQDDDITVLTLTRREIGQPSTAQHTTPIPSPI